QRLQLQKKTIINSCDFRFGFHSFLTLSHLLCAEDPGDPQDGYEWEFPIVSLGYTAGTNLHQYLLSANRSYYCRLEPDFAGEGTHLHTITHTITHTQSHKFTTQSHTQLHTQSHTQSHKQSHTQSLTHNHSHTITHNHTLRFTRYIHTHTQIHTD